jgi:2-oxoglutarate dehydrogenase E1 component
MEPDRTNSQSLAFVEGLFEDWLRDRASVPADWQRHFEAFGEPVGQRVGPSFTPSSVFDPPSGPTARGVGGSELDAVQLQDKMRRLVHAYRVRGHLHAQLDPLGIPRPRCDELDLAFHGLSEADLDRAVTAPGSQGGSPSTLRAVLDRTEETYARSIGVQYMHIDDSSVKAWLQNRMEATGNRLELHRDAQVRILTKLTDAVMFEEFIQKKFLGAKSFSLEGAESLVPLLDLAIEGAAEYGVDEIVLGMAHRGRLNVLANVLRKSPRQIFREFEDTDPELHMGRGDVKYHLGHSCDLETTSGHRVHLSLCFNPSHLEFVNPVALGRMRAKQDRTGEDGRRRGLVLLIHGDAAFAGEGVVQETLNLSELEAYSTGGTLHVVINNQVGFTTPPEDSRSGIYCTDVARMLQVPIFHVNGEDPEAVAQVVHLALEFRHRFGRDVVIDMYGYRRRGHNEGDEPSFTHPEMYQAIAARKGVRDGYLDHLLGMEGVTRAEADEIQARRRADLEEELSVARREDYVPTADSQDQLWHGYVGGSETEVARVETGVERERLADLLRRLAATPAGFHVHPKLRRFLDGRVKMAQGERALDWSAAEALALATLTADGARLRITGQDSERGTFSHRHAVLHDVNDGTRWCSLAHLGPDQGPVTIRNSPLSETGVLGFEYGYSLDAPDALVVWEAQFGDFVNVAQVIIDQFICSAEDKWNRLSGLVLLLPHGFEGQGPEHSSARLDRWLSLAAEENVQIVNPTTPAQFFHVLRRQVVRPWRKPLVVMTPKSLLRHPAAVSALDELAAGGFQRVLHDPRELDPGQVHRVLACSGKVYYDLEAHREKTAREDVAILRLEQLYPLQNEDLERALAPYPDNVPVVWVQEEPENMGAWHSLRRHYGERVFGRHPLARVSREPSASPATGSMASHKIEQQEILERSFDLTT